MSKNRLLVVGNGMAGLKFLEEIIAVAPDKFQITAVGEEPEVAYNRVLLSPLLAGEITSDEVQTRPRDWYSDHNIELMTGTRVVTLDRKSSLAELSNGTKISFDVCVLATGSSPVRLSVPGADLHGVEVFRSITDVARLAQAATNGGRCIVIGGGLLGIEAAYGLRRAGADVSLLHVMDRLMERQLDAAAAELLRAALEAKGINVVLNAHTERIEGDSSVKRLVLKSGEAFPTSLVVMAVGVRPRADIARAAGLVCQRGVLVDDKMQTSESDILAIGECAEHRGAVYGLVEPAYEHARVAAQVLAGKSTEYQGTLLATNLKVSGVPVFSAGDYEGKSAETIVWRDDAVGAYRKFIVRNSRLEGVVLIGDTTDALWYRDLIRSQKPITQFRSSLAFGREFAEAA